MSKLQQSCYFCKLKVLPISNATYYAEGGVSVGDFRLLSREEGEFVSPCSCFISHKSCLLNWINSRHSQRCSMCGKKMQIATEKKKLKFWNFPNNSTFRKFVFILVSLLVITAGSIWVFVLLYRVLDFVTGLLLAFQEL